MARGGEASSSKSLQVPEQRPQAAPVRLLRAIFNRGNLFGVVLGAAPPVLLGLGSAGAVAGFFTVRFLYSKAEQRVPFTKRRHVILLPSQAEVLLGEYLYDQFLTEQMQHKALLDKNHRDTKLVTKVAKRLIDVVSGGEHGGGYQKHVKLFKWQVSVVSEDTMNAFVMPGGKIVVYTGLLNLLGRDEDLLAMVLGHECAHALARHSSEKMGLGLAISIGLSLLAAGLGAGPSEEQQRKMQEQRQATQRDRRRQGYHHHAVHLAGEQQEEEEEQYNASTLPPGASAAAPMGSGRGGAAAAGPPLPPWMDERIVSALTSVLLELPFSRRAETEADLIGLKVMALAGYNPDKGPRAFELLAQAGGGKPAARSRQKHTAELLISGLGCTHPDSTGRAQLLQQELAWMKANAKTGQDDVNTKVNYWSL